MRLKRKASFSLSPSSSASTSSPRRDQSSPFQPLKLPDNHPFPGTNGWPLTEPCPPSATAFPDGLPSYFNSRTRKRFRDGRPDEETIHQNTLSRLFSAQRERQNILEAGPVMSGHGRDTFVPSSSSANSGPETCAAFSSGPAQSRQHERSTAQRSLDGFFNANGGRRTSQSSSAGSTAPTQPLWQVAHAPTNGALTPFSILTCEDCYAPLLTATSRSAVDVDMMDMEGPMIEYEVDDGWECVRCR